VGETFDHIREYLWDELSPFFHDAGFKTEALEYGWVPHFNGDNPRGVLNRLTRWLMPLSPALGDEFYLRLVKR